MKKDGEADPEYGTGNKQSGLSDRVMQAMCEMPSLVLESGKNFDFAIDEILARVGNLFSASRVYVMLDEKDGRYLRNTHEWVNQRIGPSMFSWPLYDYEYDIPSMKSILEEHTFFVGNTREMPEDLTHVMQKQGVQSFVIAPITRDGLRLGLVGMDFCEEECRQCPEHGIAIRFLAGMISLTLERKQYHTLRNKLAVIRNTIADLDPAFDNNDQDDTAGVLRHSKPMTLLDAERRIIIETLELYNGNKLKTAKHLGLTWPSLDRRCKKLGIEVRRR